MEIEWGELTAMERNEYLKLCRRWAMGDEGARVRCRFGEYKPWGYRLTFDKEGNARNTAILRDLKYPYSLLDVEVEKVESI